MSLGGGGPWPQLPTPGYTPGHMIILNAKHIFKMFYFKDDILLYYQLYLLQTALLQTVQSQIFLEFI
jgi:hypothetical protein